MYLSSHHYTSAVCRLPSTSLRGQGKWCPCSMTAANSPATKLPENKELQKPSTTVQRHSDMKKLCHCRPTAMALCRIRYHKMSAANSQTPFPHLVWRTAMGMLAEGQWHLIGWYVWRHQPDPDSHLACCRSTEFKNCHHGKHFLVNIIFLFFPLPTVLVSPPWSQTVPKYMIVSGKTGSINQTLAVLQLPLMCEFQTEMGGIKHLHKSESLGKLSPTPH